MLKAVYHRKWIQNVVAAACLLVILHLTVAFYFWKPTTFSPIQRVTNKSFIPHKVWQILIAPAPGSAGTNIAIKGISIPDTTTWVDKNPYLSYTLLGGDGAKSFLELHYSDRPEIIQTYNAIASPAAKSDLLRYLVLYAEGGVYSDIDTRAIRPIDQWIPEPYKAEAKAIIGIEYDQLDNDPGEWAFPLQFAQYTIAAAPGHPILGEMVRQSMDNINGIAKSRNVTLEEVKFEDVDVLNATGPVTWTGTVWDYIRNTVPRYKDGTVRSLSGITEPTICGDVLVLPINAFGMGQVHSHSARWGTPHDALVRHYFKGSWRLHPW